MPTIHLLIRGKVQGVFFRATAKQVAKSLGIKGWVRNTEEGHVETIASGSEPALQEFEQWCHRGPESAIVTEVLIAQMPEESYPDFSIRK